MTASISDRPQVSAIRMALAGGATARDVADRFNLGTADRVGSWWRRQRPTTPRLQLQAALHRR